MRKHLILTICVLLMFQLNFGQSKAPTFPNLKIQANEMVNAVLKEDYEKFANYMYPPLLEKFEGKDKFIDFTKKSFAEMKSTGFEIEEYRVLKTIQILRHERQIFGVLQTQMKMKTPDKPILINGNVIGISDDRGKTWKFIRVDSKDMLKVFFPKLTNKLKIQPDKSS